MRPSYYVQTGSMYENPFGTPIDEIERMRKELPLDVVAQAIFGKFVESSGLVFTSELVNQLFDRSIPTVMGDYWVDKPHTMKVRAEQQFSFNQYRVAVGVDLARKKDYTVIFALDTQCTPKRVIYYKRLNRVPWEVIYAEIGKAQWLYGAELLVDATGSGGDVVMEELESRLYCPVHHQAYSLSAANCPKWGKRNASSRDGRCGRETRRIDPQPYIFSSSSKVQLINHLQDCLGHGYDPGDPEGQFGLLRCPPIHQLQEEMTEYAWDDKKLSTDCVFALALAAYQGIEGVVDNVLAQSIYGA